MSMPMVRKPAHLVALSCLYICWKVPLFVTPLILLGITGTFQLSTTLTLKKFLLSSCQGWPCCGSLSHCPPLSQNHMAWSTLPRPFGILWTMVMSAWWRRSSRVGKPSSASLAWFLFALLPLFIWNRIQKGRHGPRKEKKIHDQRVGCPLPGVAR